MTILICRDRHFWVNLKIDKNHMFQKKKYEKCKTNIY